ncbi:hypothetical protein [Halorussus sp. MSC15.2]|uniref:hypothetical protein n=1 Tax=Halorussus sp. MSC15.2 TaxID=2283638 RepID=UPI0013D24BB1|nr:hypothetical protein [Halorussus sp. MSC15.2]NEU58924.1 hypothetical protein [Halorussus sp. MSC15.2]
MASIIQNVLDMIGYFTDVAFAFPTSILLLTVGFLLVVLPSLVFGYLAAGGIVDYIVPDSVGRPPAHQR